MAVGPGIITWDDRKGGRRQRTVAAAALLALAATPLLRVGTAVAAPVTQVIVRAEAGELAAAESAVSSLGGHVRATIRLVNGAVVTIPAAAVPALRVSPGVAAVTPDATVHLLGASSAPAGAFDAATDAGSLYSTARIVGAAHAWEQGFTGRDVDVALIDSGVAPVQGMAGKVVNGPDLSFESGSPALVDNDSFGHGTHMAGIIGGRDQAQGDPRSYHDAARFDGIAPDARIVSLKVADANGLTDVSQMLAAIDWVVQHRSDPVMHLNIRVLNLSFGTDSTQPYTVDPLAYAAEQAWANGIVVVVAAGNSGNNAAVTDPGYDPFVLTVGAVDTNGHLDTGGQAVANFSGGQTGGRIPDVVAPGVHIASLRDPGSTVDGAYGSSAAVEGRFFRGSGTSQACAVVSGAAAVFIQAHPGYTPDQVKDAFTATAHKLDAPHALQGSGEIDLATAMPHNSKPSEVAQHHTPSSGAGTLDGSRGSAVVSDSGHALTGDTDIFGAHLDPRALAAAEATASAWSGDTFNGEPWAGSGWGTDAFHRSSWISGGWSPTDWARSSWSRSSWSRSSWSATGWSRSSWSGSEWDAFGWQRSSWSRSSWSRSSWSDDSWS